MLPSKSHLTSSFSDKMLVCITKHVEKNLRNLSLESVDLRVFLSKLVFTQAKYIVTHVHVPLGTGAD